MPEFRVDVIGSQITAIHAGAGILFPVGTYVRSGIVGGAGVAAGGLSARTDFVAAFQLDPFRQSRWAPYAGGGISFRHDSRSRISNRSFLLAYIGVEGARRGKFAQAFELGLGGGVRAGVILRRARNGRR